MVAKPCRVDEDKTQNESENAQHHVDKLDFIFVKMHLLNHFSEYIHQGGRISNPSSKLQERAMMDLKYTYQQLNDQEAAFQTVQVKPQKVVFRL